MNDILNRKYEFLLHEYEAANKLTLHVDELRSKLTSFYLTIAGSIVVVISIFLNTDSNTNILVHLEKITSLFLFMIAIIGVIFLGVIARIRKVQIEHYRILNNIRKHFLGSDYDLWNVVELSSVTIPSPNRKSGTYFWSFSIILLNSYIIAFSLYLVGAEVFSQPLQIVVSITSMLVMLFMQDWLYLRLATPPPARKYSVTNEP